jgi:hypothetical protein
MIGLAACYADAFDTDMLLNVDDTTAAKQLVDTALDACTAIGRDPATLRLTSGCALGLDGFQDAPGAPEAIVHGSRQEIVGKLAGYAALGIDHFTFWLHPWSLASIERLAPIVDAAHAL